MNLFNCLGVCQVTSTKQTNSKEIMVYIPSYFPLSDGELTPTGEVVEQSGLKKDGTSKTTKVLATNSVTATWMGEGNRLTPPDVRAGSNVIIYRVGDSDKLLWTVHGLDVEKRRLETVMWGFSGNPNTDQDSPFSIDDYYVLEVSTHTGKVSFRTSAANGEPATFELQFNTAGGNFTVADSEGNLIGVDAINRMLTMANQDGSSVSISKKNVFLKCEDTVGISATETLGIITKHITVSAEDINIEAPNGTNIKSNVNIVGNVGIAGDMDVIASEGAEGHMKSSGNIEAQGDIIAGGGRVSLLGHKHSGVQGGNDNTEAPVGGNK